jgi:UDP-N-acetylmuramate--alanine ligase
MSNKPLKIFFSGIGGSGVSAIACFIADRGHEVWGSDRAFDTNPNHPVYALFKTKGIKIVRQDGNGIDNSFDMAIFSTAVEHNNPEFIKAKSLNIPVKTRPEFLAQIVSEFKTIAIAGTSGKSTTSGMLAFLMQKLGLEPNFIGGGRVKQFRTDTNPGNSLVGKSESLVIEACESDGTIVNYIPEHTVILNLAVDHHSVSETAEMFNKLIKNTTGRIILNADDNNIKLLKHGNAVHFSIDSRSKYKAEKIIYKPFDTEFSLSGTSFKLSIPGKYNLYNSLACIAILSETGIPLKDISGILHEFTGIERRFDIHLNSGNRLVIDDYAHNPHKISSLMQAVQKTTDSVCYIFQPHGFGPTRMMKNEYIEAFSQNLRYKDLLLLLPIFYAGGTVSKDISSEDLAQGVKASGKNAEAVKDRNEAMVKCRNYNTCIVMGARDETLSDFARLIANSL